MIQQLKSPNFHLTAESGQLSSPNQRFSWRILMAEYSLVAGLISVRFRAPAFFPLFLGGLHLSKS